MFLYITYIHFEGKVIIYYFCSKLFKKKISDVLQKLFNPSIFMYAAQPKLYHSKGLRVDPNGHMTDPNAI